MQNNLSKPELDTNSNYMPPGIIKEVRGLSRESPKTMLVGDPRPYTAIFAWGYTDQQVSTFAAVAKMVHDWCVAANTASSNVNVKVHLYNVTIDKGIVYSQKESTILCAKHVNSGYCYYKSHPVSIHIYRHDEVGFILCHELIHAYGLEDFYLPDSEQTKLDKYLRNTYGLSPACGFEAVTDALAIIIWSQFIATTYKNKTPNLPPLASILSRQREFAWQQAAIVLSLMSPGKRMKIKQETPAFEYFVIRAIILRHWGDQPSKLTAAIIIGWIEADIGELFQKASTIRIDESEVVRLRRNLIL